MFGRAARRCSAGSCSAALGSARPAGVSQHRVWQGNAQQVVLGWAPGLSSARPALGRGASQLVA
eukprot:10479204-Alexandrium_andersonii.AAC.1